MSLKEGLEQTVEGWAQLGHPALMYLYSDQPIRLSVQPLVITTKQ